MFIYTSQDVIFFVLVLLFLMLGPILWVLSKLESLETRYKNWIESKPSSGSLLESVRRHLELKRREKLTKDHISYFFQNKFIGKPKETITIESFQDLNLMCETNGFQPNPFMRVSWAVENDVIKAFHIDLDLINR